MKKYFYTDGVDSFGPMDMDELKAKNITKDTNVWFEELGDWKPAGTVPELSPLFEVAPPVPEPVVTVTPDPVQQPTSNTQKQYGHTQDNMPKTYLTESILVTLFCCLPFGIAGIVNAGRVTSKFNEGDIDGANKASENAKKWSIVALVCGLIYITISVIVAIAGEM